MPIGDQHSVATGTADSAEARITTTPIRLTTRRLQDIAEPKGFRVSL